MSIFDIYIEKVAQYKEDLREKGRQIVEMKCPSSVDELLSNMPVKVGPGANPRVILRSETFIELGNPSAGSCSMLLWSDNPSVINDGRITLIGPDIQESAGASLPFAQVLMIGGNTIVQEDQPSIEQTVYITDRIEGYMIRSVPRRMWSRIGKDAAGKGFDFKTLGKALMAIFKSDIPKIESMEVVFVTSGREDLVPLESMATQIREIAKNITSEIWKARGYDVDCILGGDCRSCETKPVCDDIRKMVNLRKKKGDMEKAQSEARGVP